MGFLKTLLLILFVGLISFFAGRFTSDSNSNSNSDLDEDFFIEETAFESDKNNETVNESIENNSKKTVVEKNNFEKTKNYDRREKREVEIEEDERSSFFPTSKNNIAPVDNGTPIAEIDEDDTQVSEEKRIPISPIMDEADSEDLDRLAEQMPEDAERLREVFGQREISDREAVEMSPELEAASDEIAPLSEEELRIDE